MADEKKINDSARPEASSKAPQEEPILARLKGESGQATGVTSYTGLLSKSSKPGYWLLHTDLGLSRSLEIREEDIVHSEQLTADRSPFGSLGGTRVFVRKGAEVISTRTSSRTLKAGDEFDLDVRLGGKSGVTTQEQCIGTENGTTCAAECGGGGTGDGQTCLTCRSCEGSCRATCFDTCRTLCETCPGDTCVTCNCPTHAGHNTCQTCHTKCGTCQTCATQCGTCQTCATQCGTCQTQCHQATCATCQTHCDTCQTCKTCPGDTCKACTHVTCFRTCAGGIC